MYARAAKPTEETPRIEECIQLFNGLTIWVVCNILRELTIVKRAVIVEKFIDCTKVCTSIYTTVQALMLGTLSNHTLSFSYHNHVCVCVSTQYLLKLRCYNTLLAVVGGLNHFSIRRLSQTWSKVDKTRRTELEKMTQFFNSQMNYSTYRQAVNSLAKDFYIPVL